MTRPTERVLACLAVLALCLVGAGLVVLRERGTQTVAVTADPADAIRPADPAQPSASAVPELPAAGSSTPAVTPDPTVAATSKAQAKTAAARAAAAAKAAAKAKAKAKAEAAAKKKVVAAPVGRASSSKKGASVWAQDGLKASMADAGISWYYTWRSDHGGVSAPKGAQFVPMIWNAADTNAQTLADAKKSGTNILLGFNEPDQPQQSNMTVDQALNLWPQLEATRMRLGSPAVSWAADQTGGWLEQFMAGAKKRGYRVDFITLHWYGADFTSATAVAQLKTYIQAVRAKYHKPIWLTEYALTNFKSAPQFPTGQQEATFIRQSTAMLQKLPYVERYAWFALPTARNGADETGLYRPGNIPTLAGKAYRAAR
jgi:hypothetical protein